MVFFISNISLKYYTTTLLIKSKLRSSIPDESSATRPKGQMSQHIVIVLICGFLVWARCDVSNRNSVLETAAKVREEVGDVTVLVNNAGIMPSHTLPGHKPEEIRKIFDINVLAHFWVSG